MLKRIVGLLGLVCLLVVGMAGTAAADEHLVNLGAGLSGANEVGGADTDGSGTASISLNKQTSEVCFELNVSNVDDVQAAHIHVGGAGSNGGVVISLDYPATLGTGCVSGDVPTIAAIATNPSLYYVNVHSAEFPGGAIRGQLATAATGPASSAGELAFTGSSLTAMLAIAGATMVVAGGLVLRLAPQRRED